MNSDPMQTCLVCGKLDDENYSSEYLGEIYYFSSEDCKKRFDENPEGYI